MATERAATGEASIDAVLAALRRAAEQDGVEDVDAVVAEFATFVRAQAPRIASRPPRASAMSRHAGTWRTAAVALTAAAAVVGAMGTGLVANPFLGAPTSRTIADASGVATPGLDPADPSASAAIAPDAPAAAPSNGAANGAANDAANAASGAAADVITPAVDAPSAGVETMTFSDPDALALVEQQAAGPVPVPDPGATYATNAGGTTNAGSTTNAASTVSTAVTEPVTEPDSEPGIEPVTEPAAEPFATTGSPTGEPGEPGETSPTGPPTTSGEATPLQMLEEEIG